MKQLVLALSAPPDPSFDNFVVGRNAELVAMLQTFATGTADERFVYVWGASGSGRSHLLSAVAQAARRSMLVVVLSASAPQRIEQLDDDALVILDDVERLDPTSQIALFALYNRIRDGGVGRLLVAGPAAPGALPVRADLATRLAWGLVYEVQGLDDAEKAAAMCTHASARGFELPGDVQDYILRHARRDLPSLLGLIERLDRYSLEQRRPVTVPLVREVLLRQDGDGETR